MLHFKTPDEVQDLLVVIDQILAKAARGLHEKHVRDIAR